MKLLVTGGAGYLGSELVELAVACGWDVTVTALNRDPLRGEIVRVDLRQPDAAERAFLVSRPDAVIHTAYRQGEAELAGDVVEATRNVARAARRTGARLVQISTDLVFDGEREGRYTEDDEPRPVSAYGAAKLEAERLARSEGGDALIARTSLLYGKPGPQEALARRDDVAFYTDEIRTPIHVSDLAAALLELAESDLQGVLHVAGADAVSRYELARRLAAAEGRNPDQIRGATSEGSGRARNVALDSARATRLLETRLRGIREVLHSL